MLQIVTYILYIIYIVFFIYKYFCFLNILYWDYIVFYSYYAILNIFFLYLFIVYLFTSGSANFTNSFSKRLFPKFRTSLITTNTFSVRSFEFIHRVVMNQYPNLKASTSIKQSLIERTDFDIFLQQLNPIVKQRRTILFAIAIIINSKDCDNHNVSVNET